jgi:hypothetical protein
MKEATRSSLQGVGEPRRMKKMTIRRISTLAFSLLIISLTAGMPGQETKAAIPATLVALAPSVAIVAKIGDTFTETVTISTSDQVNNVNFRISFNASLLNAVSVDQGSFFPQQFPPTNFTVVKNSTAGTISISAELLDAQTQTGNGSLATVVFMVSTDPKSVAPSTIGLDQVSIMNAAQQPITYDTMNAVWFWKQTEPPPPPPPPRVIDVYTQRGGTGANAYGGEFAAGSMVVLSAYATYNSFPVQRITVAFQILDAKNETVALLVGTTDESGIATVEFRVRFDQSVEGTWWVVASGDISSTIVWDTVTFTVIFPQPVGGYTITLRKQPDFTAQYLIIMAALTTAFAMTKRRLRKK